MLSAIALYFVVGCIVAVGFRRVLADTADMMVRLIRLACEVDPDIRVMVASFAAFAALCWPAFIAAMVAITHEEKKEEKRRVDLQR